MTDLPAIREQEFELLQREARALQQSSFVPDKLKKNISDCMSVIAIAKKMGVSSSLAAQNIQEVYGIIGWKTPFVISRFNSCGRFSPLRFKTEGEGSTLSCYAYSTSKEDGERLDGPKVTMKMAIDEGWLNKTGSKWKTMPGLMIQYRAASFFVKLYAPEILNGMQTAEEVEDIGRMPKDVTPKGVSPTDIMNELEEAPKVEVIEPPDQKKAAANDVKGDEEPFFEKK